MLEPPTEIRPRTKFFKDIRDQHIHLSPQNIESIREQIRFLSNLLKISRYNSHLFTGKGKDGEGFIDLLKNKIYDIYSQFKYIKDVAMYNPDIVIVKISDPRDLSDRIIYEKLPPEIQNKVTMMATARNNNNHHCGSLFIKFNKKEDALDFLINDATFEDRELLFPFDKQDKYNGIFSGKNRQSFQVWREKKRSSSSQSLQSSQSSQQQKLEYKWFGSLIKTC